jgi:hypothetical protein
LEIAKAGGRHSGFLRQAQSWTRTQLERASNSFQRQIELHEAKVANPGNFVENWGDLDPRAQTGLVRHWESEISNFVQQQQIVHELLGR